MTEKDCEQTKSPETEDCNDDTEKCETASDSQSEVQNEASSEEGKCSEIEDKLHQKEKESEEYLDLLKRTKAEFDNFRKRTIKEKESMYDDGFAEGFQTFLPIVDNLERALSYNTSEEETEFRKGVEMVMKLFTDTIKKAGIEEISALGEEFNPHYHNAVMHVDDETLGENVVAEVLQKGYLYKEKVLRYCMVKVAN